MFKNEKGASMADEDDQCYTCTMFAGKKQCPLIEALGCKIVDFQDEFFVKNCNWYKPNKLKLVDNK